jgi:hypothetical protein
MLTSDVLGVRKAMSGIAFCCAWVPANGRGAAQQQHQFAPPYSITSSGSIVGARSSTGRFTRPSPWCSSLADCAAMQDSAKGTFSRLPLVETADAMPKGGRRDWERDRGYSGGGMKSRQLPRLA